MMGHLPKADTYGVLGLNERVIDGNDIDFVMLNAVDSCQRS